jgi:hypothetical protein
MLSLFLQEASVSSAPYFFGYMGAAFALVFASALPVSQRRTAERGAATGTRGLAYAAGGSAHMLRSPASHGLAPCKVAVLGVLLALCLSLTPLAACAVSLRHGRCVRHG